MNLLQKKTFQDLSYFKLGSNLFGRPKMFVYSFLVDEMLIDTGQPHIRKEFLAALQNENLQKIIVTHHHEDHSGNIEAIKQLKNINAYASPICCEILKKTAKSRTSSFVGMGANAQSPLATTLLQQATDHSKWTFHL